MTRTLTAAALVALACAALVVADESSVEFDPQVDFSAFKTFAFREVTVDSARPEIDNPLFVKDLGAAIRRALIERRLTEAPDRPDLLVAYRVTNEEVSTTRRGGDARLRFPSPGPQSVRYTQGTLVIDLRRPGDSAPIWRGVYRDDEKTGAKLVEKLPVDAKKLIDRYPPPKPKR